MGTRPRLRARDERGAALVEFALVIVLLSMFLFGIISFGALFSVKQTVTQAASDGARAAVVVPQSADEAINENAPARTTARAQVANAASWLHGPAGVPTITCPETAMPGGTLLMTADQPLGCHTAIAPCAGNTAKQCLTLTVGYAYGAHPVVPALPFVGQLMPSQMRSTATIQLDGPTATNGGLVQ